MQKGKEILKKEVISVSNGRKLGTIEDLYLGTSLERIRALDITTESGLFNRTTRLIPFDHVVRLGVDVVLVEDDDVTRAEDELAQTALWTRLSQLRGRKVDTTGGTHIGRITDVIISDEGDILGYALGDIAVKGPIAQKRAVALDTITDLGHEDGIMTIDLEKAERQELSLE
ncbi:MAG: PRC-barrel domain-containing protein [Chloroflexota bacterium]|nr:PRC-barrel domain-containing protein [Chloroflexota bacterium]